MLNFIDNFLNRITMYRLVLYYLIGLLGAAFILSFLGLLHYSPAALAFSSIAILLISWASNNLFAYIFKVPANVESVYITALILILIIAPPTAGLTSTISLIFWASVWAMASKFIVTRKKKHIFNPAAFAVALTALTLNQSANWWVGSLYLLPFVLLGGFLVARKISRFDLVLPFFITALSGVIISTLMKGANPINALQTTLLVSPLFFFAFVMLTEPLTTPPSRFSRVVYGALVGVLFAPAVHFGSIYSTPELALLFGNVFSYLVSPKERLMLKLKEKIQLSPDLFDFVFTPDQKINFRPGQYMEWTLGHERSDSRGNRRYFTVASSPTEPDMRLGVKFYPNPSSFKRSLFYLKTGDSIAASQLAGNFVLPRKNKKLVFIAGGIGITPYRSMIKYLLDKNEPRDIILFYSAKTAPEIIYRDVFDEAQRRLGIKTVYVLTDEQKTPLNFQSEIGYLSPEMIMRQVPDWSQRTFYLSGPRSMVLSFEESLKTIGVPGSNIKIDYFPGFA